MLHQPWLHLGLDFVSQTAQSFSVLIDILLCAATSCIPALVIRAHISRAQRLFEAPPRLSAMSDTSQISSYLGYSHEVIYTVASSSVVLLYDIALTFDREVRLVWRAPWNLAKGLFLFLRYFCPLCVFLTIAIPLRATSDVRTDCLVFSAMFTITAYISKCAVDLLMLIRVYAIWGRSIKILASMGVLYAISNISSGIADIEYLATMRKYVMSNNSCFRSRASPLIYVSWSSAVSAKPRSTQYPLSCPSGAWAPLCLSAHLATYPAACRWALLTLDIAHAQLAYDTVAFLLTLIKGIQHWRAKRIRSPLIYVFYRDGVGYFAILTILRILTIIGSTVENVSRPPIVLMQLLVQVSLLIVIRHVTPCS
ncbi:hypothetical protein BOTBODRAFT_447375 [Botryobasidium botryosum FD-172 SS1]|uniref:DUF6533 domain-containing protein n=1 Tax=Botryobasidium botryosum (strain FD-172 SS1) TaxID=930990 RepID=A0A067MJV0_BOTB1|nr:hypothetical protein BOTBODRAFT_447375 [Botryobasidium botryosum FD-172 SS1]